MAAMHTVTHCDKLVAVQRTSLIAVQGAPNWSLSTAETVGVDDGRQHPEWLPSLKHPVSRTKAFQGP